LVDPTPPSFTLVVNNPTTCGGTDGSVTINGLTPFTVYDLSYLAGATPVAGSITTNGLGQYFITGLSANSYSNFSLVINGCVGTNLGPAVLVDPTPPAAPAAGFSTTYCSGDAMADMNAVPGAGGVITWYSDAALTNVLGTGTTFSPLTTIGTTNYYVTETVLNCESLATLVQITINPTPSAPVAGTDATYCDGQAIANLTATSSMGGALTWFDDALLTNDVGVGPTLARSILLVQLPIM
jgi:hypothetical protein